MAIADHGDAKTRHVAELHQLLEVELQQRMSGCCVAGRHGGQQAKRERAKGLQTQMAERVGFEPTVEFLLHTLSKRAP
jgi:hypothetical protein